MEFQETSLPGVLILEPKRFGDGRGFFSESYNPDHLRAAGIQIDFSRDNHSMSSKAGTVRGLHFQAPPFAQAKIVRCSTGRLFDVAVDIRRGSPTYGKWISVELSAENGRQLFIPEGFAHGFATLADDTEVQYKISAPYSPECEGAIRWNDQDIGIEWPVGDEDISISAKDEIAPLFSELESPFTWSGDDNHAKSAPAKINLTQRQRVELTLREFPEEARDFIGAVVDLIDERLAMLEARTPNHPEKITKWKRNQSFLIELKGLLQEILGKVNVAKTDGPKAVLDDTVGLLELYRNKISAWPKEHVDEVTDGAMRVALVGVCGGVGLIFGVPTIAAGVGAAMFCGEKIGRALANASKSAGG